jgi:RHS repeat-associated protein
MPEAKATEPGSAERSAFSPPTISLPKGGGAIRGIGEKFAANPVTGTGSMTVPIATSPGRSGFGPQLSLSYDSGAGNGAFGLGWSLSLPAITRKTEKGLPRYFDAEESDVFILSGAEDLVPVGDPDPVEGYAIRRYRPRIEGLFARIERWTKDGDVHWRSISKDNVLTLYGKDANSRIADPADIKRVFSWLICETRDDKGNAVAYEYKKEDGIGVDLSSAHERNRGARNDKRREVNRYLKRVRYGNRVPVLDAQGNRPRFLTNDDIKNAGWMFEVVFDYGEHDLNTPKPGDAGDWDYREDPFSVYRAGFELRTCRLCRRVLMFHHFPGEPEVDVDCLVRSTDFTYSDTPDPLTAGAPVYAFLRAVTQGGYRRQGAGYLKRSLPPLEFEYTKPLVQGVVEDVGAESLENLPIGLDGRSYQWADLHGEGIPGILTEQADAWFYKRNISPISDRPVAFAPLERVVTRPNVTVNGGQAQFMDLAGDGQPDVVVLDGPTPGLYEHDNEEGWEPFRPFTFGLNRNTRDPNLKFVDLDGDGHADVLISEDDALVWHRSLAEDGFGPAQRVSQAIDEENGPRLVFADATQSIHLADLSGDGLTDLVRIRNGEVCYWPNLGYGRFGAKVTMDGAPSFDAPDQFNPKRLRLADIDGCGTTDLIYLHRDSVRIYFNQSGNGWSQPKALPAFPDVADPISITPTDLLGNGTACLVWSSPLPSDVPRRMRYVNLMGENKPHLLIKTVNNLGAETRIHYAPSTKFYLQDKRDGRPWLTRLPFPVHVVDRVETFDWISRNRFVTRYAYHEGYFDGEEREFRGFGMVEQFDTERFAVLSQSDDLPTGDNVDEASHVPPVLTKTWFHTGAYLRGDEISRHLAHQYLGAPQGDGALLADTVLPDAILTGDERRQAVRALKGLMLRQEVYGLDGTDKADLPYAVTEQNFSIRLLQPQNGNRHAVFFTHPCECISYHYERELADPRVSHTLTLEVDAFGNVLKAATVGYGRVQADPALTLQVDRDKQTTALLTYTENEVTNTIEETGAYRTPLPSESRTYELTGYAPSGAAGRFQASDFVKWDPGPPRRLVHTFDAEIAYEEAATNGRQRRLIERLCTRYRGDDLTGLLDPRVLHSLALPGETYKLAFTPGLLTQVYRRPRQGQPIESLLPNPGAVLPVDGGYVDLETDGHWWIPSGRVFFSPDTTHGPAAELAFARQHFLLPHRYRDPFHTTAVPTETVVDYDTHDLLVLKTRDAVGNLVTVETADDAGVVAVRNDYRVLQPYWVTDPNGSRTQVAFDALGLVVGIAVMGRPGEGLGGSLDGFVADPTPQQIDDFYDALDPHGLAPSRLQRATTRVVYDVDRYRNTGTPTFAATIARETYTAAGVDPKTQITFAYSDGYGREIQKKIQAEPGPVVDSGPTVSPRWVGSGWTIFNNKGKPVRQFEPFFSQLAQKRHQFEFGKKVGVSPILFYDPVERVVATLHPNHTYEKVAFNPWRQATWDVNDTVKLDPRTDPDVGGFFLAPDGSARLPESDFLPSWHALRTDPANAAAATQRWPDPRTRDAEKDAAQKTEVHKETPTIAYFDALGRAFLTVAHNRFERVKPDLTTELVDEKYPTRVTLDIEGNQREVRDAVVQDNDDRGRAVMRHDYDMLGNRIHQASMEAGRRWMLNDLTGKPIRVWDSRGHTTRTGYDVLRRSLRVFVTGADPANPNQELLTERVVYGEQHPQQQALRLRGRLYLHLDQAGAATNEEHDFQGNLIRTVRRLAREYRRAVGWDAANAAVPVDAKLPFNAAALEGAIVPAIEGNPFSTSTSFDALNRPVTVTTPDQSVARPTYNEANLLEELEVNLRGAAAATPFVTDIDYNAKGQRTLIEYANGAKTTYAYDADTFRLIHLKTRRPAGLNGLATQLFADPTIVQDLHYAYDPAGNITRIRDEALPAIQFSNENVLPRCDYRYDATYRLITATGREHIGQTALDFAPADGNYRDYPFVGFRASPNDPKAIRNYTQTYNYDAVGNITRLGHQATGGPGPLVYAYQEPSLLEPTKKSNRLTNTALGNRAPDPYTYDAHGNITSMSHLPVMRWDYRDELQATAQQVVNNGTPETTWYVYDSTGQRVRKVTDNEAAAGQTPVRKAERVYLGGFEIYRTYQADGVNKNLERETVHVLDDRQRIALVEDRTTDVNGTDMAPAHVARYQFGNHLSTAVLELNDAADMISHEEYYPYGATSYQAVRNQTETPKRYRYARKERDEETGFNYHGARYYSPWNGRWIRCEPLGLEDGPNLFIYCRCNPICHSDQYGLRSDEFVAGDDVQAYPTVAHVNIGHHVGDAVRDLDASVETAPASEQEPDLLEQVGEYLVESPTAQFLAGSVTGALAGAAPGGFLVGIVGEESKLAEAYPPAFRAGYGAGEAAWGIAQIVAGGVGEVGGVALDATGVGALAGVPLNIASAAAIVEGVADVGVGVGVFMSALSDLPEGTHKVVDDPNVDDTRSTTHAEALEANLEREGMPRPPNHEPHHVVASTDPRGARAAEILEEAGIGIDDAANGVWLPRTSAGSKTPRGIQAEAATSHDAVHTDRYYKVLTERLERAREFDLVWEELKAIRLELELGVFPW